ncbi:MAG: dihydrodipicolinate synthase family protein [Spirochaetaceae bacterium]|nr:MAG: dihydrodipicolinate synthase family protein [Spirochaetaceae bacterium]
MHAELINRMKGIIVALSTPLTAQGSLDEAGAERLVESVITNGVSCIFPLGWCGEGPLLTDRVRRDTMKSVCRLARGRVPLMVGVSEQSLPRVEELLRVAEAAGADCVLATMPYSYELSQQLVYTFFEGLSRLTKLPIVIYENSELGVFIGIDCLKKLSEIENIIGVKATVPAGNLRSYYEQLHNPDHFAVISGDEYLYDYALLMGFRHFTMGGPGNICARWCTSMYEDAVAGRVLDVMQKQAQLVAFLTAVYGTSDSAYSVIKYVLARMGICEDRISSPHRTLTVDEQAEADAVLGKHQQILDGPLV